MQKRNEILVIDDTFPNIITGFRVAEYNYYLNTIPNLRVLSICPDFDQKHREYADRYPTLASRVLPFSDEALSNCRLAYINFINNAKTFLPNLERQNIPFILNIYPGGGFGIKEERSDLILSRILISPLLRAIITTQRITTEYISRFNYSGESHEIFGGCVNPIYLEEPKRNTATNTIRACFAAERYISNGENKGYPTFIDIASTLSKSLSRIEFNVVGGHRRDNIKLPPHLDKVTNFLGRMDTGKLRSFFETQDLIISPNQPFILTPGNFDGFPTGCCVEASLCGVAMFVTDPLNLNNGHYNDDEIVICEPVADDFVNKIIELTNNKEILHEVGRRGMAKSRRLYSVEQQLKSRRKIIERHYTELIKCL